MTTPWIQRALRVAIAARCASASPAATPRPSAVTRSAGSGASAAISIVRSGDAGQDWRAVSYVVFDAPNAAFTWPFCLALVAALLVPFVAARHAYHRLIRETERTPSGAVKCERSISYP